MNISSVDNKIHVLLESLVQVQRFYQKVFQVTLDFTKSCSLNTHTTLLKLRISKMMFEEKLDYVRSVLLVENCLSIQLERL